MYILCKYIDYLESDLDTGPWFSMFDNSNGKTNRALASSLSLYCFRHVKLSIQIY